MAHGKFGTVINCMDGRTQLPVLEYLKKEYALDYVDSITEAGPNGLLAKGSPQTLITSIRDRIEISLNAHGSTLVAVVGHYDCAGNPGSKEKQVEDVVAAAKNIKGWYPEVKIIGLWVDENWQVFEVPL